MHKRAQDVPAEPVTPAEWWPGGPPIPQDVAGALEREAALGAILARLWLGGHAQLARALDRLLGGGLIVAPGVVGDADHLLRELRDQPGEVDLGDRARGLPVSDVAVEVAERLFDQLERHIDAVIAVSVPDRARHWQVTDAVAASLAEWAAAWTQAALNALELAGDRLVP